METNNNTAGNMNTTTQTTDMGNNETLSVGVYETSDGYTALTFSASKTFKTLGGARRWFARRMPITAAQLW